MKKVKMVDGKLTVLDEKRLSKTTMELEKLLKTLNGVISQTTRTGNIRGQAVKDHEGSVAKYINNQLNKAKTHLDKAYDLIDDAEIEAGDNS